MNAADKSRPKTPVSNAETPSVLAETPSGRPDLATRSKYTPGTETSKSKVKERYHRGVKRRRRSICFPQFLPKGSTSSWRGVEPPRHSNSTDVLTLFFVSFSGKGGARFHYEVNLEALTKPLHGVEATSQRWRLPTRSGAS